MQRGRRNDFNFGDPFSGFGGFGRPGSIRSSFFGGRDPFDDPFFTRPFGSMFGPRTSQSRGSLFGEASNNVFLEQPPAQQNKSQGPVIQEITSDEDDNDEREIRTKESRNNSGHHSRHGKAPFVQDPEEVAEENKMNQVKYMNEYQRPSWQGARTYSFQSSKVTYGGLNGAYYTSSTTRKTGSDGVMVEESKEADTTTGKATHRISRGIRDKGHSITRKLNSDGTVENLQTLHNLNEDELAGFEEAWKGNARDHLPGRDPGLDSHDNGKMGGRRTRPNEQGRALLSIDQAPEGMKEEHHGIYNYLRECFCLRPWKAIRVLRCE